MTTIEKRHESPDSSTSNHSSKDEVAMVEAAPGDESVGFDEKASKRLVRKIDIKLVGFKREAESHELGTFSRAVTGKKID